MKRPTPIKELTAPVVTFKLAAALETYEMDLRALAEPGVQPHRLRRLQREFGELRRLGAALPRLSVSWVAVLVSRARLLQAICSRSGAAASALLHEHVAAVQALRQRCLRLLGAQAVLLA